MDDNQKKLLKLGKYLLSYYFDDKEKVRKLYVTKTKDNEFKVVWEMKF